MTTPTTAITPRVDNVLRAMATTAWAMRPDALAHLAETIRRGLRADRETAPSPTYAERVGAVLTAARGAAASGGKAVVVLPVQGMILPTRDPVADYYGIAYTPCDAFGDAFVAAMSDPTISAVVLDVNSPGGSVAGVPELAARMFKARGAKPVIAVATECMASAAYWIAAQADTITATTSAFVGSIGVFVMHQDYSGMFAEMGITNTIVKAGAHKAEANPYEPLSDEDRAALQATVDEFYGFFVAGVAKGRNVSVSTVKNDYGEGRCLTASAAKSAGLVDKIATLDQTLGALGARASRTAFRADDDAPALAASVVPLTPVAAFGALGALGVSHAPPALPVPDARAGALGDSPTAHVVPTTPAPAARSVSVSDSLAAPGAATLPDATALVAAERKRVSDIHAMVASNRALNVPSATVDGWVNAGASADAVGRELLALHGASSAARPVITGGADRSADKPFANVGEYVFAVVQAGRPGGARDPRLARINATASGMNESVGSEGGFFLAPELVSQVMEPTYTDDPILSRVSRLPISGQTNSIAFNVVDETSRVSGSRWGGITMAWGGEADGATASKPKLRRVQMTLGKLIGAAYLTDELSVDAPASQVLLGNAFSAELKFMLADSILRGTGAGQPQGILNSGATVSQAIESAQTIANTGTSIATNLTKMLARIPASLWGEVIWLYNQELLPYLITATIGSGGAVPVFMAVGGLADRPNDTILGRSAFASELCEAVGTPGDIMAIVPSQYMLAEKGGAQVATSVHVRFLNDENTLRITYRADGTPLWRTSITPYKGANARSPFVTLAVRS